MFSGKALHDVRKKAVSKYQKDLVAMKGFCLPTTCGYQTLWKLSRKSNKGVESSVGQYFCMGGLRLNVMTDDGISHHFLASTFAHNTSVAVLKEGEVISIGSVDPDVLIYAWGRYGGSKQYKSNTARISGIQRKNRLRKHNAAKEAGGKSREETKKKQSLAQCKIICHC